VEEAIAEVEDSIELEPRWEKNYRMLGAWNTFLLGNFDQAIYWMRRAYEVNPETGFLAGYVANSYAKLGMREEALAWIDRTLEMGPTHYWAWQMAGSVHRKLGDDDIAAAYFEKADALNPGKKESIWGRNPELQKQIRKDVEAGQGQRALQRFEEAYPEMIGGPDGNFEYGKELLWGQYAGVLWDAGEVERSRRLAEDMASHLEDECSEGWYLMGTGSDLCMMLIGIYAGLEDRERTLATLRRFIVDEHRRHDWSYWRSVVFDLVGDDPEFEAMVDYVKADLAAQRERVREMERNGEMPPAPGVEFIP
jgi:tetratricopeptide (TPR) repeat protein